MSIPSQQIYQMTLCLHWRGQRCDFSGSQGVVAVASEGTIHEASISEADLSNDCLLAFKFERAHGWVSLQRISGTDGFCINGHLLNAGPVLIKEASLMLPPHTGQAIELFLCESLADWQNEIDGNGQFSLNPPSLKTRFVQYVDGDSVAAKKLNLLHDANTKAEYALASDDENPIAIHDIYNYGALRFEIMDDECWVSVDDGILKVNDQRTFSLQLFVGDKVEWQQKTWHIVGGSALRRILDVAPEQRSPKEEPLADEPLFPDLEEGLECMPQQEQLEDELEDFRRKLDGWLHESFELNSFESAGPHRPLKPSQSISQLDSESHLALLRLGRKHHIWRSADKHQTSGAQSFELLQRSAKSKALPKLSQVGTLALAMVVGVVGGIAIMGLIASG